MGCYNSSEKRKKTNKYSSSDGSICHFCNKYFSESEYYGHTRSCSQREITCSNLWCKEKILQGDLQSHMEQCAKKQTSYCSKCGKSVLVLDLQRHMENCSPIQCPHCLENCLGRILKYCPHLLLGRMRLTVGPFAYEELRTKFNFVKDRPNQGLAELNYNISRIQHLFRWVKTKALIEDTIFRLIHKEMDLKKEGFAMFKAHDKDDSKVALKSRSVLTSPQIAGAANDHYFPFKLEEPITTFHICRMIQDLTTHVLLPYNAAWKVFSDALNILPSLANVVHITPPTGARNINGRWQQGGKIIVVGDLHGQLADLLHILKEGGIPSESTFYIFNGDFVDRGPYGMEVLLVLFSLFCAFPKFVSLNRGNHECDYMNDEYGFDVEVSTKYDRNMFRLIQRCFCALPLVTVVGNKVMVVHGGLPRRKGITFKDINRIERFRQIPMPEHSQPEDDEIFQDLLWSDPYDCYGWQESDRGAGVQFGPDVTSDFMKLNSLSLIIRSHEVFVKGYEEHHDGNLITVFSASNYDGIDTNNGSFIVLAGDITEPAFHTYQVYMDEFEGTGDVETDLGKTFTELPIKSSFMPGISGKNFRRKRIKDEVLRLLRECIYKRRHRLLTYFTKLDRTQKGTLWKSEWVEAMRNVLNIDLPWFFLRRYIVEADSNSSRIQYSKFLSRFMNRLMRLWLADWEKDAVQGLIARQRSAKTILRRAFDKEFINYNEFCSGMRDIDHTFSNAQLFQLFQFFDREGNGLISTSAIFNEIEIASQSPPKPMSWDLDAMDQFQNLMIQGRSQLSVIFKITPKEKMLTKEKFLAGMDIIARGMKKQLKKEHREKIFTFLAKDKEEINFDEFIKAFSVYDESENSNFTSTDTLLA